MHMYSYYMRLTAQDSRHAMQVSLPTQDTRLASEVILPLVTEKMKTIGKLSECHTLSQPWES